MNRTRSRGEKAAAGSGRGSAAASDGLVSDPGPAFTPGDVDDVGELAPAAGAELLVEWTEERVQVILRAQGALTHMALAVDPESGEWRWQEDELAAVAGPLAAVLNRHDSARALAGTSDELAVITGLGAYVARSWTDRRQAQRTRDDQAEPAVAPPDPVGAAAAAEWVEDLDAVPVYDPPPQRPAR